MQAETTEDTPVTEESGFDPNSTVGTIIVAMVLCLVCSLVVSTAAVQLRPLQKLNAENKKKRNVLIAAGIWDKKVHSDADIPTLFENIETKFVNLPAGKDGAVAGTYNEDVDPSYDQDKAAKDPEQNFTIPSKEDIAGIKRREVVSAVYLVNNESGELETIVLPVYGKGLWSTLYGFLALESDASTVKGITFYKHAETPGLGGEVDNPKWQAQWPGKIAIGEDGEPVLDVTKPGNAGDDNEIEGISGATITSNGVEYTMQYWLSDKAFGPFLDRIRNNELAVQE